MRELARSTVTNGTLAAAVIVVLSALGSAWFDLDAKIEAERALAELGRHRLWDRINEEEAYRQELAFLVAETKATAEANRALLAQILTVITTERTPDE